MQSSENFSSQEKTTGWEHCQKMDGSCEPGKRALQDCKGRLKTLMLAVTEIKESFLAFSDIEMCKEEALGWKGRLLGASLLR